MVSFAECVEIKSKLRANDLNEIQEHLVRTLTDELRKADEKASSESHRGNVRLEQFCDDYETSPELMRERFFGVVVPYGMSRDCSFSPSNS